MINWGKVINANKNTITTEVKFPVAIDIIFYSLL